jgi:hypothetical protein
MRNYRMEKLIYIYIYIYMYKRNCLGSVPIKHKFSSVVQNIPIEFRNQTAYHSMGFGNKTAAA